MSVFFMSKQKAFTLVELLVVIAVIGILVSMLLPVLAKGKARSLEINCVGNLKQITIAATGFAANHRERYPMQVSTNEGGSKQWVLQGEAYRHFLPLSNDLIVPMILLCPADRPRWSTNSWAFLSNSNLSYFMVYDCQPGNAMQVFSGDRNILNQTWSVGSIRAITTNFNAQWSAELHNKRGNLLFGDGHVERTDNTQLNDAMRQHLSTLSN